MKAIDTNVLVRYLVQDDPRQGRKAADYIAAAAEAGDQILIGNIVLCETVWGSGLRVRIRQARDRVGPRKDITVHYFSI